MDQSAGNTQPIPAATVAGESCGNCHFSRFILQKTDAVQCRFDPPMQFMLMANGKPAFITEWRTVPRIGWCGKFKPKLSIQN